MRMRIALLFGTALLPLIGLAQSINDGPSLSNATLAEVLVTGEYPGPGLWKITHPETGHVLWLVGQPPLLPTGMRWRTRDIEQVAAQSQLIVLDGGFSIVADGKVGFFRAMSLVPGILRARKNPNGEQLHDLVPVEIYARWREQKTRYMDRDSSSEKWRPMFAAAALRTEALKAFRGKSAANPPANLWSTLRRIAKEQGIKIATPSVSIKIPPKEMRATVKQFNSQSLDDLACFTDSIAFVEALADVEHIEIRAKAWATGDLATLRRVSPLPNFNDACNAALANSETAATYAVGDVPKRLRAAWITEVETSMLVNASTLAVIPIDELLAVDGRLDALRSKGYAIEEPRAD
jgi:hypothetical protein